MRNVELIPDIERLADMTQLYGRFDLDINTGCPTESWERRYLFHLRLEYPLQSTWFPEFWYKRVRVNRRAAESLNRILHDLRVFFGPEEIEKQGLNQFVRCYNFGGKIPSLFWYGAAWELSPKVGGDALAQTTKIFLQHGWTYAGLEDRKRLREFEYW
jgi:hypothetical protein